VPNLDVLIESRTNAATATRATVDTLVIAGWTGRDQAALDAHIAELAQLGVPRPKTTPVFYRVAASLLTVDDYIQVVGQESSGEVEPVLMRLDEGLCVGVGSDHTDRKLETIGITVSKQLCPKPISTTWWPYSEVENHWDRIEIRSFAFKNGTRRLYQEGTLSAMRRPGELIARCFAEEQVLPRGTAMFCGTLAVHGAIEHADAYELEIADPVLKRSIRRKYFVKTLPTE
jgi:hypothetical protein